MTNSHANTCPLSQRVLLDEYFMEHRTQVLDLAAFLDRLDRSVEHNAADDFRYVALRAALGALSAATSGRVETIQMLLSDPDVRLLDERDRQNAQGAFQSEAEVRP